jgi:hypothetical protein
MASTSLLPPANSHGHNRKASHTHSAINGAVPWQQKYSILGASTLIISFFSFLVFKKITYNVSMPSRLPLLYDYDSWYSFFLFNTFLILGPFNLYFAEWLRSRQDLDIGTVGVFSLQFSCTNNHRISHDLISSLNSHLSIFRLSIFQSRFLPLDFVSHNQ